MKKENLIIVELVDGISAKANLSIDAMMKEGKKLLDHFRTLPENWNAIEETILNIGNPEFKVSKYGDVKAFLLFVNSVLFILISQRERLYKNMPEELGSKVWKEITEFYITYTLASLNCLDTQMTTMSDVIKGVSELRNHFMSHYLPKHINFL